MQFGKGASIDDTTDEYYTEYLVKLAEEKHAKDHKKRSNKEPMKIEVRFEEQSRGKTQKSRAEPSSGALYGNDIAVPAGVTVGCNCGWTATQGEVLKGNEDYVAKSSGGKDTTKYSSSNNSNDSGYSSSKGKSSGNY